MSTDEISKLDVPLIADGQSEGNRSFHRFLIIQWCALKSLPGWNQLVGFLLPLAILFIWEISTRFHWIKPYFVPPPLAVVQTIYDMFVKEQLLYDFWVSGVVVVEGYFVGSIVGLAVGFVAGLSKTAEKFFNPTLNTIRQVPPMAWLPLFILWLGVGDLSKAVIVGKAVFFPVFLNTLQGIRSVPNDYIEVGRIFGYSRFQMLRKIVFPAALPTIFVGLRYGAGLAWAVMIAAEMIGNRYGLGFLLIRAQELLLTTQLYAIIILIGTVGFLLDVGLRKLESHCLRWRKNYEGS